MRERLERSATLLFATCAMIMAIICGAVIISGWFAGVMDDRAERFFWAGAVLAFVNVGVLAGAAFPGGEDDARTVRRVLWLVRLGLVLFVVAPALCIGSLVGDFYG